ncbi:hypothetical protein [Streptomyces sp. NBC_01264]|nr:hypothetical protein [Streptomyces sp. NBC_01264]MCX4784359.1 hypothetical protein [Streptomyces sp. NBC_01264]
MGKRRSYDAELMARQGGAGAAQAGAEHRALHMLATPALQLP